MAEPALPLPQTEGSPPIWRGLSWRERLTSRYALGLGYAVAAVLTALSVWLSSIQQHKVMLLYNKIIEMEYHWNWRKMMPQSLL